MHSDNLNFLSFERGWFFQNGNIWILSQNGRSSLLEVTAEMGFWYGLLKYFVMPEGCLAQPNLEVHH